MLPQKKMEQNRKKLKRKIIFTINISLIYLSSKNTCIPMVHLFLKHVDWHNFLLQPPTQK